MPLTALHPGVIPGQRFGSFAGKDSGVPPGPHPVGRLTRLRGGAIAGGLYGSFVKAEAPAPTPTPEPAAVKTGTSSGGSGGGRKYIPPKTIYFNPPPFEHKVRPRGLTVPTVVAGAPIVRHWLPPLKRPKIVGFDLPLIDVGPVAVRLHENPQRFSVRANGVNLSDLFEQPGPIRAEFVLRAYRYKATGHTVRPKSTVPRDALALIDPDLPYVLDLMETK